jgi:hypothetical protein
MENMLTIKLRIKDDKFRANLTSTLALQKRDKSTKILKVKCVARS